MKLLKAILVLLVSFAVFFSVFLVASVLEPEDAERIKEYLKQGSQPPREPYRSELLRETEESSTEVVEDDTVCRQFGVCTVCAHFDAFTDELLFHHLDCGEVASIRVACDPKQDGHFVAVLFSREIAVLPDYMTVRFRFDDKPFWAAYAIRAVSNSGAARVLGLEEQPYATALYLLDGFSTSQSVMHELARTDSSVLEISKFSFRRRDGARAVAELESRCE